jgi:hypothetical protein
MNRHVRERMTFLGVDNVALAPILMGWTWNPASGTSVYRNPDAYWDGDVYDFMGIDPYETDMFTTINTIVDWAEANDAVLAVGEWGFTGSSSSDGQKVYDWYELGVANGFAAMVVWDANQNGYTYELVGGQLSAFHDLLSDPRTQR